MIPRTQALLNQSPLKIHGGTFHAMGLTVLKIYGAAIGLHNTFSIMDEDDATGVSHILASKRGCTSRTGCPTKQHIAAVLSRAANMLRPIPDVVATHFPWLEEHTPQLVTLYRVYTATKWQQHRLDYDDLLLLLYKLLCIHAPMRLRLAHHYQAILVDEYQDSTQLQAMIIELVASEHQNVMVLGDDAQCVMAGTPILTEGGYRPVESLRAGEEILSGGGNGNLIAKKILKITESSHGSFVSIYTQRGHRLNPTQSSLLGETRGQ